MKKNVARKYPKPLFLWEAPPFTATCGMPSRPPKPCAQPGCPELTHATRCDEHKPKKWQGDNRPSARQRGYDARWEKVRRRYAAKNPLCERCAEEGKTVTLDVVDHIVPIKDGGKRLSFANLQSLCHTHHNRKTAREGR